MKRLRNYLFLMLIWAFGCADSSTDTALWEQYMSAGKTAYQQHQYEEALWQVERALKEAEAFGEQDLRYAATLNNLAELTLPGPRALQRGRAALQASTGHSRRRVGSRASECGDESLQPGRALPRPGALHRGRAVIPAGLNDR